MHANNSQREKRNRSLLTFGYLRNISDKICSIPHDVRKLIFTFYDNGVAWLISSSQHDSDHSMNTFLSCKTQDTMYGPIFEPMHGMTCQLTLSPNGYNSTDKGYVMCYFEVHKFPTYLKNITLSFTLYLKEAQYEYIRSVCYHQHGINKCHGWSNSISLSDVKRRRCEALHIECVVDVIHAQFKKSCKRDNIVSIVPYIGGSKFDWNVSDTLLNAFKTTRSYKLFYSDTFYKNCWMLRCAPFGFNQNTRRQCWVFLQLIRAPFRIKSIHIAWSINAHYQMGAFASRTFNIHQSGMNWFSLDMDGADGWGKNLFSFTMLERMETLSFSVKLQVMEIRTYE